MSNFIFSLNQTFFSNNSLRITCFRNLNCCGQPFILYLGILLRMILPTMLVVVWCRCKHFVTEFAGEPRHPSMHCHVVQPSGPYRKPLMANSALELGEFHWVLGVLRFEM